MPFAHPADRLFDGLLKLLPQEFRDRHGREIVQVFRAERAEAVTRRERAAVWLQTMIGLLRTAPVEHLSILRHDVRFAARGLGRYRAFTAAATLTLALPVAAITGVFGLLNTLAFQPLPFPDVDRTLMVDEFSTTSDGSVRRLRASTAAFHALAARADLFEGVAAHRRGSFTLSGPAGVEWVPAATISRGWSRLVPARPRAGRLFTTGEEAAGSATHAAVISERLFAAYGQSSTSEAGATIVLDGERYQVIGVMPDDFRYPYGAEIWIPGAFEPEDHDLLIVARAQPGVTLTAINQELAGEAKRLAERDPVGRGGLGLSARAVRGSVLMGADRTAWLLLGSLALVLLIAAANVVHLLLVRVAARHREFCIRAALGANRSRQVRQIVTETIVLFSIAAALGLAASPLVGRLVFALVPNVLRAQLGVQRIAVGGTTVLFVAAVTLALALLLGLAAAALAPRARVTAVLDEELPAAPASRARRLTRMAIVGQVALALVLVSCAAFLVRGYGRLRAEALGLDPGKVLTLQIDLTAPAYRASGARAGAIETAVGAVQRLPGVVSAAVTSVNPICCYDWGVYLVREGGDESPTAPRFAVHHRDVTAEFFNVLGIRLKRGRAFTETDTLEAEPVAIIDQRVADRLWPGQNPIGRRLRIAFEEREHPWRTVVGVAERVNDNGSFEATWYVPVAQHPDQPTLSRVHLMIKAKDDPLALAPAVRSAIDGGVAPLAPFAITTLEAQRAQALSNDRVSAFLVTSFAVFGLLLASIGIYGVTANAVERRLPELGIRMAFGAGRTAVVRAASDRALRLSAAGCAIGSVAAFVVGALLERAIFNTATADPLAIAGAATVVAVVSLAACVVPAWRAASLVPRAALHRWE